MPSAYRLKPKQQFYGARDRLRAKRKKAKNPELGIIPLVAAAAPAAIGAVGSIGKGIGKLFGIGKKKKKAAPPPTATAPKPTSSASSVSAHSSGAIKSHSKKSKASESHDAGLAGVPTDVKAEALAALNQFQTENQADKTQHADLVQKLAAVVKPQVDKMHEDVKKAELQRTVTSEHNKLMKDSERWNANDAAHQAILKKFDELQAALVGSNNTTKRVFKIYGVNV